MQIIYTVSEYDVISISTLNIKDILIFVSNMKLITY